MKWMGLDVEGNEGKAQDKMFFTMVARADLPRVWIMHLISHHDNASAQLNSTQLSEQKHQ